MKTSLFLSALVATFAAAVSIPRDTPLLSGDAGVVLTTGVGSKTETGHVPIRREIRDLQTNFPDLFNVYILGLRSFQLTDQNDPVSFYQIAGIHGRPYVPWQKAENAPGQGGMGYCPHSNTMFFGWHRAYLALYEQELYKHVQGMASQFPETLRQRYIAAASDFRIPYWEWTLGDSSSVPEVFTMPTINVIGTDGVQQTVPNPLHHYQFHPLVPGDFDYDYSRMNTTTRWPTSYESDSVSQNGKFIADFARQRQGMHDTIASGYAKAEDMNRFSVNYLENVHGWVHFSIGGSEPFAGHMWPVEFSAFEPLFMLHHCQVDRLFELWSAANPDRYILPQDIGSDGTFAIARHTTVDADTPLAPFWSTPATYWTTNQVKDTTVLGYAYPETMKWSFSSEEMYRAHINATIAQLYSSSARARLSQANGGKGGDLTRLNTDNTFTDWTIGAEASQYEMPSTFIVRFSFVGMFSSDPVTEVGSWIRLMASNPNTDHSKAKRASTLEPGLKSTISLTGALMDDIVAGKLESLEPEIVVPYLEEKLTWKVYAGNGTLIPHNHVPSLRVQVTSTKVQIPNEPKIPLDYSDKPVYYPKITVGKGGSN